MIQYIHSFSSITDNRHIHAGGSPDRYRTHTQFIVLYTVLKSIHYMQYEMQLHCINNYCTLPDTKNHKIPQCMW